MEKPMLGVTIRDKIRNDKMHRQVDDIDIITYIAIMELGIWEWSVNYLSGYPESIKEVEDVYQCVAKIISREMQTIGCKPLNAQRNGHVSERPMSRYGRKWQDGYFIDVGISE